MPWMLQPKSYNQIARPNLYNVAYRRVGTYKGMGRLNPTNYLQIGVRPNQIGATTGQYNTLSGQLSLLPPSLRGLGQTAVDINTLWNLPMNPISLTPTSDSSVNLSTLYPAAAAAYQGTASGAAPLGAGLPASPGTKPNWTPWIILIGGVLLFGLMGARR